MTQRLTLRLGALLTALTLMTALTLTTASPAHAWGTSTSCPSGSIERHTNRWDPFAGHHMDVFTGQCTSAGSRTVPPHLRWVRVPTITFPTRNIVFGPLETLKVVQKPFVSRTERCFGGPTTCLVVYRWVVQQCTLKIGCQTFGFKIRVTMLSSQICFVGRSSCDTPKGW